MPWIQHTERPTARPDLPTRMDDALADFLGDRIDVHEYEQQVGAMLAAGTADEVDVDRHRQDLPLFPAFETEPVVA